MTQPKRPLKVFLCHAHADRDPVRALWTRLTNDGVDAWLDKEKLLPGQDWELEIKKAVRETDLVIVCLSKQFNQAGFRQKEVKLALDTAMEKSDGEIFIVPARLEECDTLESLRRWHWVDLFEDNGYKKLTQTLSLRAEKVGALFTSSRSELDISKLTGYSLGGQIGILNNLALTYQHADDFLRALEYF
ncbi:MAG: toll/interleukin-1 receptor domain-containing protein [Anaerolineales bacterium]|uniref:toll/interleukin-1 receptor domain-containing protein n=1 Tax=Candidatus Villigracilis vicinus TaxID=3140679 RepID=UPI00313766AC|nr:toll/interleukin-1 receptor domain-containing protein [Anaerolineales bacterium]